MPVIRFKRGNGEPSSLLPGEPGYDLQNQRLYVGDTSGMTLIGPVDSDDKKVKVSTQDTSPDFLAAKVVGGTGITVAKQGTGNETLRVSRVADGLPTGGTAGQLLYKRSGADYDAEWGAGIIYPRRGVMWHDQSIVLGGGTITSVRATGHDYLVCYRQNPAANGDTWTNGCLLRAGTYKVTLLIATGSTGARMDLYKRENDGAETLLESGIEFYSGTTTYSVIRTLSNVVVQSNCWLRLRGTINGRNASSTGWNYWITKIDFVPSAD